MWTQATPQRQQMNIVIKSLTLLIEELEPGEVPELITAYGTLSNLPNGLYWHESGKEFYRFVPHPHGRYSCRVWFHDSVICASQFQVDLLKGDKRKDGITLALESLVPVDEVVPFHLEATLVIPFV
jgi:hypothetical protein